MATRQHKNTSQYSPLPLPLEGTEQVEVWRNGTQYQTTLDVLGGNPGPHGESHESGSDRIGTQTPTADAIVRGDDNGQVNDWVADASTNVKGKVQLAEHNEEASNKAVQSDDPRNKNARPPTAHAASHIGGTDDLGLGTAALLDVGVADGVCGLDSSGKVSSSNLPSYVDDVIEAANYAALPVTGETGKIYVTLDDNLTYRWTGSAYVEISKSLALGETSSTAYRGDRGKIAYDHSQDAHAPSDADNTQGAINGASGKTTLSDNDLLALLDSGAGNALKKLLWSNVKATLKTYFDTLYTSSGGDTPENILSKLLTVDGYNSGLVSEDSGKLGGMNANKFVFGSDDYGQSGITNCNDAARPGFYRLEAPFANSPETPTTAFFVINFPWGGGVDYILQIAFKYSGGTSYFRVKTPSSWGNWNKIWNSANVGTNWATALGAALGSGWASALAEPRLSIFSSYPKAAIAVNTLIYENTTVQSLDGAGANNLIHFYLINVPGGRYRFVYDTDVYEYNSSQIHASIKAYNCASRGDVTEIYNGGWTTRSHDVLLFGEGSIILTLARGGTMTSRSQARNFRVYSDAEAGSEQLARVNVALKEFYGARATLPPPYVFN